MVNVEVGVPAELDWQNDIIEGVLHLIEGEEKEIVCSATEGYPLMDFGWTSYRGNMGRPLARSGREFRAVGVLDKQMNSSDFIFANNTRQATFSQIPGSNLYSGSQSLTYRASISDNGTIIKCRIQQRTADGSVLYTSDVELQLHVQHMIIIQNMAMEERIGVISGIILAIIFIILIFILIAFFLTKRRKQNKKYLNVPDKSQEDLLTPIWIPGKTSSVHVSSA